MKSFSLLDISRSQLIPESFAKFSETVRDVCKITRVSQAINCQVLNALKQCKIDFIMTSVYDRLKDLVKYQQLKNTL